MQIKSTQQTLALHKAVEQHDTEKIRELRSEGHKTVHLNDEKQSPIDLLARRRSIDTGLREKMHGALMSSLNPTAPEGYTKPEALHGSPWGFEILAAGALKGGVNDAKGGSASLEGQVFFSDRTPEKSDDATTRLNLRSKARIYSQGEGMHTSNPVARAFQHRMAQEIRHHLASGKALTTTNKLFTLDVQNEHTPEQATALWLQSKLTGSRINIIQQSEDASLAGSAKLLDVPEPFNLKFNDGSQQSFSGEALKQLVDRGAETLQQQLEAGKAPLLGMINNGKIVPMVFGFSRIDDLKSHSIPTLFGNNSKNFSYQSENHPLSGSDKGGKLKEIELRSLQDFTTLNLACLAKGVQIPSGTLIRLNPTPREKQDNNLKARYLNPQQSAGFQQKLAAMLKDENIEIQGASLTDLQRINQDLRGRDLAVLL